MKEIKARGLKSTHTENAKKLNILITGASGSLATLARNIFSRHNVTLLSSLPCECGPNETWIRSRKLQDLNWWTECKFDVFFDLVLHFAEPVRAKLSQNDVEKVILSHIEFIKNISLSAKFVIYPQTALVYDKYLSSCDNNYVKIKRGVILSIGKISNLSSPIIHPIVDYGVGLSRFIYVVKKIPFLNLLCSFKSTLPILYKSDLEIYLKSNDESIFKAQDWYSCITPISEIFHNKNKFDVMLLSKLLFFVAIFFLRINKICLLINGRKIPEGIYEKNS